VTPGARESDLGRTGLIAVAGLLIMWEALGRLDVSMFVPPVTTVAAAWWHLVGDGTLTRAAASSLVSLVKGFVPAAVLGERLPRIGAEARGQQGVVADLGMPVEREVVGREVDVGREERPQPRGGRRRQGAWRPVPEDAVVDQHETRTGGDGVLEELERRRHARDHAIDVGPTGHLEAVGAVVVKGGDVEQVVQKADNLVRWGHWSIQEEVS